MKLSVVLCTHNPDPAILSRTLAALHAQTLSKELWELVLVDNSSSPSVSERVNLNGVANLRLIYEPRLGTAYCRSTGMKEAAGPILVFVDDDNILREDYLERAVNIGATHTQLGAWGGSCVGEFESKPQAEFLPYLKYLAVRKIERDSWANFVDWDNFYRYMPIGAGMCFRKCVGDAHVSAIEGSAVRGGLGRAGKNGKSLASAEDTDLALTAIEMGLGIGCFKSLELTHVIPSFRTKEEYLLRLIEGIFFASFVLRHARGSSAKPRISLAARWRSKCRSWVEDLLLPKLSFSGKVQVAMRRGERKAIAHLAE